MPAKHAQELRETYSHLALGYNQAHIDDVDTGRADYFLSLLPPRSHILDFGAGNGRDSHYFVTKGYDSTLLDSSPEMLKFAQQNVPTGNFIQVDMVDAQLPPQSFNGIWANASLLHLTKEEVVPVIANLFSALKERGILFVRVKEGSGEKKLIGTKYGSTKPNTKRFFSFYSEDELTSMMKKVGFHILKHETYFSKTSQMNWVVVIGQKT